MAPRAVIENIESLEENAYGSKKRVQKLAFSPEQEATTQTCQKRFEKRPILFANECIERQDKTMSGHRRLVG